MHGLIYIFAKSDLLYVWDKATPEGKAIIVTLVIHYVYYKLLKVPLPWGILERFAW